MKLALILMVSTGVASAEVLPHEYQDDGACKIVVYDGTRVVRTEEFSRDREGRLEGERLTVDNVVIATSYAYEGGRLASTSMDGDHAAFEYDTRNQLVKAAYQRAGSKLVTYVWTFGYDAQGRHVHTLATRGTRTVVDKRYSYDPKGRLDTITSDDLVERHAYDRAGRVIRRDEITGTLTKSFTYAYDAKGRLASQTQGTTRHVYDYGCRK